MRSIILTCGLAVVLAVAAAAGQPKAASGKSAAPQAPAVNPIDRWNRMSPEERERALAKLPPGRARMIRERIRRYNQLPEQEKQVLRERYQRFTELSLPQQALVRWRMQQFRGLPLARRAVVGREIQQLLALPEAQRHDRLNSQEFQSRFSTQEQEIVRDITDIFSQPPK